MHVVVKVFSEIIIKSTPVRKRFIKQLRDNLRLLLRNLGVEVDVQRDWEKIEIRCRIGIGHHRQPTRDGEVIQTLDHRVAVLRTEGPQDQTLCSQSIGHGLQI